MRMLQLYGGGGAAALCSSSPPFTLRVEFPDRASRLRRRPATVRSLSITAQLNRNPNNNNNNLFSVSDDALAARGFALHRSAAGLDLDQLNSVFVAVGFPRRDPEKVRVALDHTPTLLWIEHRKTQKPVAFARATGDGVFNAIIWDVVVDPSYQGIGLGKAVMERLVAELLRMGITNIALYSEPRVLGFYRPLGFAVDPDGIRGMVYSRRSQRRQKSISTM